MRTLWPYFGITCLNFLIQVQSSFPYYGTKIGTLKPLHHGVLGDVYAVDSRTIFVKNFNYDGDAPAAYFYVGSTKKPSNEGGLRLRDERGGTASLTRRYRNKDITLSLPEGKTLRDFKWFSVWCDEFAVNFGDVSIPNSLDFPKPQKISQLKGVHAVSSDPIVIVDAQTILVPNFSYDGEAPDAKFWVGRGQRPTPQGLRIPDENGKEDPLRKYDRKTIVLTLPAELTIFDIGHFGVWCEAFTVDFGHVKISEGLNVPPSLKMLGISPQSKLNCEVLYDDLAFEVRWAVAGESIVVQLVAKLASNEYMSFGISPLNEKSQMIGADVVVAWVDQESGKGYAQDYFLDDKSQCSGGRGVCPDVNIQDHSNSIRLLNAAMVNSYSIVTYQRSLAATDNLDLKISINGTQAIVWAVGPLNQRKECSFHSHFNEHTQLIEFGRPPSWNCPMPEDSKATDSSMSAEINEEAKVENSESGEEFYDNQPQALPRKDNSRPGKTQLHHQNVPTPRPANNEIAWEIPQIKCYEPEDGVFYAQMGPTGGKHGYPAITGHVGWGISWYINGLLIPEIHVIRGKTYTFVIEGGHNPDIPAKYHPFYITDDPVGGYEHKREEEKKTVKIFAGVYRNRSGQVKPSGVGRLCNWTPDINGPAVDDYQSFGAYQRTLTLKCDPGEPGVISWTPDHNTPDMVYYQCFTHRYLGWKIHVHDSCDDSHFAASEKHEIRVPATSLDLQTQESKVSTNVNFLLKHPNDLIKNHNMNGAPPKLSFEITKSTEITKLISDGIRAAESLEETIKYDNKQEIPNTEINNNQNNNQQQKQQLGHQVLTRNDNSSALQVQIEQKPNLFDNHQLSQSYTQPPNDHLKSEVLSSTDYHNTYHKNNKYSFNTNTSPTPTMHPKLPNQSKHYLLNRAKNLTKLSVKQTTNTIGLSEFLLPPRNTALFRPVKLPERRPFPMKFNKFNPNMPILPQQTPKNKHQHQALSQPVQPYTAGSDPQPLVIVKQYRKPASIFKTFTNKKKLPIERIAASVLLLNEPIQLNGRGSIRHNSYPTKLETMEHDSNVEVATQTRKTTIDDKVPSTPTSSNLSFLELATLKPAINKGFKPDSVIIESGFRPIVRINNNIAPSKEVATQIANRREDPGSEISEAMAADTLFLATQIATQKQQFEPMFIPSPPDTRNTHFASFHLTDQKNTTKNILHDAAKIKLENDNKMLILKEYGSVSNNTEYNLDQRTSKNATSFDSFTPEADFEEFKSEQNDSEDAIYYEDEQITAPAEQVKTFYLPPNNRKIANAVLPSGALITFDGQSIIDSSLVFAPKPITNISSPARSLNAFKSGLSKSEQLIRNTPKYKVFQGTVPPSIEKIISKNDNVPYSNLHNLVNASSNLSESKASFLINWLNTTSLRSNSYLPQSSSRTTLQNYQN